MLGTAPTLSRRGAGTGCSGAGRPRPPCDAAGASRDAPPHSRKFLATPFCSGLEVEPSRGGRERVAVPGESGGGYSETRRCGRRAGRWVLAAARCRRAAGERWRAAPGAMGKAGRREGHRSGAEKGGCLLPRGRAADGSARPCRSGRVSCLGRPCAPVSVWPPWWLPRLVPWGEKMASVASAGRAGALSRVPAWFEKGASCRSRDLAGRGRRAARAGSGHDPAPRASLWVRGASPTPSGREAATHRPTAVSRRRERPRPASPLLRSPDGSAGGAACALESLYAWKMNYFSL